MRRRRRRKATGAAAALLAAGLAFPAEAAADGDRERGRAIAEEHCSRCHVVGAKNRMGGIGSTPSFQSLSSMADALDRFASFYARPPHPVFVRIPGITPPAPDRLNTTSFELTVEQLEDIIAFAAALKAAKAESPLKKR